MQLLKNFHELSLHPQNAKELKSLILQLAIQGKLTADWRNKNPNVEPAKKLLDRLSAEKSKLIKEKKIKKEKPLPTMDKEELPIYIPDRWSYCRLGEIGDWGAGATPLRSNSAFYDGSINWFKSGELNNGIIDYDSKEKITDLALSKTSLRMNKPGDVLIAMYGATIGKTGILNVYGTTNQAVCACTCYSCIGSSYLHILLKALKQDFIGQGEGGAQPNISRVKIRNKVITLPPLEEQKAIVEVVEQLYKEVEQLEQLTEKRIQLKEQFATSALRDLTTNNTDKEWEVLQPHFHTFFNEESNIKKLREAILQLAVQGKLTSHWRTVHSPFEGGQGDAKDHNAALLLESIKQEKAQLIKEGKIKKDKPLPAIADDEIPYALPEGWEWCRLQEYLDVRDGTHDTPKYVEKGIPLVTSKNLYSKKLDLTNIKFISEKDHKEISKRSFVEKYDILFAMIGSIGNPVIVDVEPNFSIKNVALIKYYIKEICVPWYILYFLEKATQEFKSDSDGAVQSFVSLKKIRLKEFPLPPLKEQQAIVETVNHLMALCDQLEEQVKLSKGQSEKWMKGSLREVLDHENN